MVLYFLELHPSTSCIKAVDAGPADYAWPLFVICLFGLPAVKIPIIFLLYNIYGP